MIIIPMAGLSSRFAQAGYTMPKWKLPLKGRPVFDWSLLSFESYFAEEIFVIVHLDQPGVSEFLNDRLAALGIRHTRLVPLAKTTRGQSETVFKALESVSDDDGHGMTIFNIDTIRLGYRHPAEAGDGWLECFKALGDHWSFVKPAEGSRDRAAQVTEKVRISDYCSTGVYIFRNRDLFLKAYENELTNGRYAELYVAPLYQYLIETGLDIRYSLIRPGDVQFCGTPKEYELLKKIWDE